MFFSKPIETPKDPQWFVACYDFAMTNLQVAGIFETANIIVFLSKRIFIAPYGDIPILITACSITLLAGLCFLNTLGIYLRQIAEYSKDLYYQRPMNHKFQLIRHSND